MDIPVTIATEAAITRQNVALSVIKQSADQAQAVADLVAEAAQTAPVSGSRGVNVNISA